MSDITLAQITSGYNLSKINSNFTILRDAHNDVAFWRSDGNNTMLQDADLNGFDLLNVGEVHTGVLTIGGVPVVPSNLGSFAPNSVGTIQIIDGAVTSTKLADSSVGTSKLQDGSVTDSKIVSGITGSKLNFIQAGLGATLKDMQSKARETISVKDFGAFGDGSSHPASSIFPDLPSAQAVYPSCLALTDELDVLAFLAVRDWLQTNSDYRGARVLIPAGHYILNRSIDFTQFDLLHGFILQGSGVSSTVLDFATAPVSTNGITFGKGAHFSLKDFMISGAPGIGLLIGNGHTVGGPDYCNFYSVENVRVQGCGNDGIRSVNSYMGAYRDVWAKNNGGNGVNFAGFHTSLECSRVESSNNAVAGFSLNGLTYCHFSGCGSDQNGTQGWAMSNILGTVFSGCGSESNNRDGFFLFTSNASAVGLNTQTSNIRGVLFEGCYALNNSVAGAGSYGCFLGATSADSRPMEFMIKSCVAFNAASGDKALILQGTSGNIICHKEAFDDAAFTTADTITGSFEVRNTSVTGRRAIAQLSSAQSLTSGSTATVTLGPLAVNDLNATIAANAIVIPRGINKVRITACQDYAANATGVRQMFLQKNGGNVLGLPAMTCAATAAGDTVISSTSAPLSVVAGDTFSMQAFQNSGGALNLNSGFNTWLSVEAIC